MMTKNLVKLCLERLSLISNMIIGVTEGYKKDLIIESGI